VDDALDGGVVRRVLVLTEREGTGAATLVGVVTLGRYDPASPADTLEVNVHLVSLTGATAAARRGPSQTIGRSSAGHRYVDESLVSCWTHVVRVGSTTANGRPRPLVVFGARPLVHEPDVVTAYRT